jgi:hypothetical protein
LPQREEGTKKVAAKNRRGHRERELIACGSRQASNFLFDLLVRHDIYEFPFVPLQFLVGVTCHRLSKLKILFLAHLFFNGALHARMQQHSATNL